MLPVVNTTDQPAVQSVTEIRRQFPALERREGGHPVAYFDGPGGTQVPQVVVDAVGDYLLQHNANTHWAYPSSAETDAALAHARDVFAGLLHGSPDEIAFGANMTTLTYHVSRALGRDIMPGDEIVVTELDHHANIDPWRALERERSAVIRWGRLVPDRGVLDLEQVIALISRRTKIVAIGAAANALGTISDLQPVIAAAHEVGALVYVDAVHFVPHELPDVQAWGCDFLACSPYKFYGPHVGVLWGRRGVLERTDFPRLDPASDEAPERGETGTLCHEGIVGAAAAVEWLASLATGSDPMRSRLRRVYRELHARGVRLTERMWTGLSAIPQVRLYGPGPQEARTPTVSFTVDGVDASDVSRALAARGVFTSHGDFYAKTVVERLGLASEGLVRAGCACYTTEQEVDRLVEGVAARVQA
jgi:cysteine desulfurase family protein (TIGR01976 family)